MGLLLKKQKLLSKNILITKFIQYVYAEDLRMKIMAYGQKMIDLQKSLCHRNLRHAAMKKIKCFCKAKHPTKEQVKK